MVLKKIEVEGEDQPEHENVKESKKQSQSTYARTSTKHEVELTEENYLILKYLEDAVKRRAQLDVTKRFLFIRRREEGENKK